MGKKKKKQKTRYLIAAVSDLHINSTVALCKPTVVLDDGGYYTASPIQTWIYQQWIDYWKWVEGYKKALGRELIVWFGGEMADNLHHHTTQLISRNEYDQKRHAVAVLQPALELADKIVVIRGSEAHVGASGWMDEWVANDISASPSGSGDDGPFSWWRWQGKIDGMVIDGAHHPGTGHGRPWTRGGDSNRLAAIVKDDYIENGLWPPDIVLRGHNHKPSDSYDNHMTRAIILPSWQLTNAFGYRLGGGWLPIGGLVLWADEEEEGRINVKKKYSKWPVSVTDYWRP